MKRRCAGGERRDSAVVRQQIRAEGVGVELFVGRKGDKLLRIDSVTLSCERKRLLIGEQEAIDEPRPDRMPDVALPQHASKRRGRAVGVFGFRPDGEYAPDADDHAA
jgi:hypothetical protein